MITIHSRSLSLVAIALMASGCELGAELETGSTQGALESENALSMNALSMNALSMNALSMNALSMNGLELSDESFADSAEGRHVLKYLIRCALPDGVSMTAEDDAENVYTFFGLLGLAPTWDSVPLTTAESERVSACLLAHVNYFGVSIAISARHPSLPIFQAEVDQFTNYEGAFFGQLFSDPPELYTCTGDAAPDFSATYPSHDTTAGDRLLRRCTDVSGAETECGFVNVGSCQTACTSLADGSVHNCSGGSSTFGDAVTIWLLEYDDASSTWPTAYDTYYGP